MTVFARNVWRDLIDKRLWPVALALVVALIAIPVVVAKPAPKAKPAAVAVASSSPEPLVATPAAIRSNAGNAPVGGTYKNPFRQQHVPKPPSQDTGTSKTTTTADAGGSAKPASGGGNSNHSSSGSGGHKKSKPQNVTTLKIRFGLADGTRRVMEITPGTPLPATTSPLIVFLDFSGSDKGKFLVSSDAVKTQGDGTCKPSNDVCSTLTIPVGGTRFFDTQDGHQYQLDVLGIDHS